MQLAAQGDGDLHQMDGKIACLHLLPTAKCTWSNCKEAVKSDACEKSVHKPSKSLYSRDQAGRKWGKNVAWVPQ